MGKDKNKGLSNLREIKYWLTRNAVRGNCWVVLNQLDKIISHDERVIKDHEGNILDSKSLTLSRDTLKYVYSAFLTTERLIALVQGEDDKIYIINNENLIKKRERRAAEREARDKKRVELMIKIRSGGLSGEEREKIMQELLDTNLEDEGACDDAQDKNQDDDTFQDCIEDEELQMAENKDQVVNLDELEAYRSTIIVCPDLSTAINEVLNKTERSSLGILKTYKMELKKAERDRLEEILAIDFMDYHKDKEGMLKLWHKFLFQRLKIARDTKSKPSIDFSGHFNITEDIIEQTNKKLLESFYEVLFLQNIQFTNLTWLRHFKKLKCLSFWYCYQLKNKHFELICRLLPDLESLNVHNCYQVNNRILVPTLQMKKLIRLCLDNRVMICQTNVYQGVVTNKEWEVLNNHSIEYLSINSDNLTNDVIDYIIKACHGLKKFLVNTLILKRLKPEIVEGYSQEKITFQSNEDIKLGFKAMRDIKIKNLLKDKYEPNFSESMEKLIEQMEEEEDKRLANGEKDPDELLEEELQREVEEEMRVKYGDSFFD